jgi:asparagine synthetase B (glutamine-hydrolysing)
MCGIQITFNKKENEIRHRGVSHFSMELHGWNVCFSSLPINSEGAKIQQPIELEGSFLLFNGEIFNYREFGRYRSDLHYLKDIFKTGIEKNKLFQKQYKQWDGFWAICIITELGVYFFTDPLGKKQLYYSNTGICSEIKPLITDDLLMRNPKFGTLNTCFQKVNRAMPGKFYFFDKDAKLPYKERTFAKDYLYLKDKIDVRDKTKKDLISMIDRSIRLRSFINYGKLGLLFSGGLDSSIIAYHLKQNGIPFIAVSINNNETEMTKKISRYLDFEVEYIGDDITEQDYKQAVLSYEYSLDYGSLLPQYKLFKKCKELGINTVLTGDGADELFGGYSRSLTADTQTFDVFMELPFFHHIRIDRMSMHHTIECRNPFLSTDLILYALNIKHEHRRNKKILREAYKDLIPFVEREKKPLRLKQDKEFNIKTIEEKFYKYYGAI